MDRKLNVMQLEMEDTVVMSEYDLVMGHLDTGATAAPPTEVSYLWPGLRRVQTLWLYCNTKRALVMNYAEELFQNNH